MVSLIRGKQPMWITNGDGSGGYGGDGGDGGDDGSGGYWKSTIPYFAAKWPIRQKIRLEELEKSGAVIAFWRSTSEGLPANGGRFAAPSTVKVGDVHEVNGPLEICTSRALHATLIPPKWRGKRYWIVALIGQVVGDDVKMAALQREIIGECL